MDPKPIWQSKTFWANLITVAIAVTTAIGGLIPESAAVVATIVGVLNIALRVLTTQPVTLTGN